MKSGHEYYASIVEVMMKKREVWGIYGYANSDGDIVYVGIDRHINLGRRHEDHIKPSKSLIEDKGYQVLHTFLKENKYKYVILVPIIFNEALARLLEQELIKVLKPIYNMTI